MAETSGRTGAAIGYDDVGEGEPTLLFIPGWCTPRTVFQRLVPPCATRYRALVMDLPGHGDSELPSPDFDNATVVEHLRTVLDGSGARQVVPVALSHGGWWALELCRQLGPHVVPALVLLDWLVLAPPPPFLQALNTLQTPQWRHAREALFSLWLHGVNSPEVIRFVREDMGAFGQTMWQRAGREIQEVYAREGSPVRALSRLASPVPTLHLYAQPEDAAWLEAQRSFAASHPWFHVRKLSSASHFPLLEIPEEMATYIVSFLDAALGTHPDGLGMSPP